MPAQRLWTARPGLYLLAPLLGWVFMAPSSSLFLLLVIRISLHHSSLADYIPKGVLLILLVLLTVASTFPTFSKNCIQTKMAVEVYLDYFFLVKLR